jgi:broad specificity phosphatase PhoE
MRLFVIARHGQSVFNVERRVNGDPDKENPLSERGRAESELLGTQIANVPLELCVHTRFPRTRETAELALAGREVRFVSEPLFDDIDVGDLDCKTIDEYRTWKRGHSRRDPFPGGESLDDAARRYAAGFRALVARGERIVLLICHEIPLRYAVNAATGSDSLDRPVHDIRNASPYLFDEDALTRAADVIDRLVGRVDRVNRGAAS